MKAEKPKVETKVTNKRAPKKVKADIYQKVFNIQQGIKAVIKTGKNTHHSYSYATERDVLAEVKPLLGREKLVILENTKEHKVDGMKHDIAVEFTIVNIENTKETLVQTFYGYGEDKAGSVVGLPIAYTMAQKYFAAKYFLVETGDDAESDQHSGTDEKKTKGKQVAPKDENPEQAVATIKTMLQNSRNVDGIIDYLQNKLPKIKQFTKEQKEEINRIGSGRVDQLQSEQK